jgi:general secretion pathway protein A
MGNLNYEGHFGLTASPFALSPDPTFLFASEQSKEALESITEAIEQRKGFVVLTGEVGTGKTLVLRCLIEAWEREEIPFAYFIGPRLSTMDFLSYVAFELGINATEGTATEPSKGTLLRGLYAFLLEQFQKGLTTVLIIDEAHLMPRSVLEEIRVLANFETAQQKLIQIVLSGQPELDKKLDSTELRSLKQRISVRCQLQPLRETDVRRYIEQRLEIAGAGERAATIFPLETVKAIHRYSGGIPRLVNNLCDQALIVTCARQLDAVPSEVIHSVAAHFRMGPALAPKPPEKRITAPGEVERPAGEKLLQAVTAIDAANGKNLSAEPRARMQVPSASIPSASGTLPTPGLSLETLAAAQGAEDNARLSSKRESAPKAIDEGRQKIPAFTLRTSLTLPEGQTREAQPVVVGETSHAAASAAQQVDDRPVKTRRWLRPGLLLVGAGALVPISVAGGLFVARHRIDSVAASQPISSAKARVALAPAAIVTQPGAANLVAKTPASIPARVQPHAASAAANTPVKPAEKAPKEPERSMAMASVAPHGGSFTHPVMMKSSKPGASIDPPTLSGAGTNSGAIDKSPLAAITGASNGPAAPAAPSNTPNDGTPHLLSHPAPEYPFLARQTHTQGDVAIQLVIDKAGNVASATVITGPPMLRDAALQAVRQWKYQPLGGQVTQTKEQVTLRFRL